MPKLPVLSGKKVVALLCREFNFVLISQRGSHIKIRKIVQKELITVIIPNHSEIAEGTMRNILRQAHIETQEYLTKF